MDASCLQALIDALPQGAVVHNPQGHIVAANQEACALLGLSMNVLLGRDSFDPRWRALRPDGSDFPGEQHPAMLAISTGNSIPPTPMGVNTPDGFIRWLTVSATPVQWEPGSEQQGAIALFNMNGVQYDLITYNNIGQLIDLNFYQLMKFNFNRLRSGLLAIERAASIEDNAEISLASTIALESAERIERWRCAYEAIGERISGDKIFNTPSWAEIESVFGENSSIFVDFKNLNFENIIPLSHALYCFLDFMSIFFGKQSVITVEKNGSLKNDSIIIYTDLKSDRIEAYFKGDINEIKSGFRSNSLEQKCFKDIINLIEDRFNVIFTFDINSKSLSVIIMNNYTIMKLNTEPA